MGLRAVPPVKPSSGAATAAGANGAEDREAAFARTQGARRKVRCRGVLKPPPQKKEKKWEIALFGEHAID